MPIQSDPYRQTTVPSLGRALAYSSASAHEQPSTLQRAVSALRSALPFVQRVLPLLDGNIGAAVSNVLGPQAPPPPPPVDLMPIHDGLAELRMQYRALRDQAVEQNGSLKRVEDQLEMVREATDRNTLEQQELMEDLKAVGNKVKMFALMGLTLLGLSIAVNVFLYLQIRHIIP
jgi:hypothetical protein